MQRLLFVLAGYGILRVAIDVVGFFRQLNSRIEEAREDEVERQKTQAMMQRHGRIGALLAKKRFSAGGLDGPEVEAIDIELLTLLQEALKEEGPCEFYEQWRNQLVRWYASQSKIGS